MSKFFIATFPHLFIVNLLRSVNVILRVQVFKIMLGKPQKSRLIGAQLCNLRQKTANLLQLATIQKETAPFIQCCFYASI